MHLVSTVALLALSLVPVDAPVVGRPREHFYGAVGERLRLTMSASPTEVRAEDPLVLTIAITGAANPEQIERPDLKQLPEFANRFHIDDLPEDAPPAGQRVFRYHLRPKTDRVRDVPPLLFHYWNPRLNYFATTAPCEAIGLSVSARDSQDGGELSKMPDWLFEQPPSDQLRRRPASLAVRVVAVTSALLVPPLIVATWFFLWRWLRPSMAKQAELRRSRAARAALNELDSAVSWGPLIADRAARVVRQYLGERFRLHRPGATPAEVCAELLKAGASTDFVERAEQFLREADAARFGPPADHRTDLANAARVLIAAAEVAS
jgi:hypothetical protein